MAEASRSGRKIRLIANISLDGVIQAPGGPEEDERGHFHHGGWAMPYFDAALSEAVVTAQGQSFGLLLGRHTYDVFAGYWPEVGSDPIADGLNAATKYVATRRPENLSWGPVEGLGADILAGVRSVKATKGPDLIIWGSTTVTPHLFDAGLIDEVALLTFPVLLGSGKHFFAGVAAPQAFRLVSTKALASGVLMSLYRAGDASQN